MMHLTWAEQLGLVQIVINYSAQVKLKKVYVGTSYQHSLNGGPSRQTDISHWEIYVSIILSQLVGSIPRL